MSIEWEKFEILIIENFYLKIKLNNNNRLNNSITNSFISNLHYFKLTKYFNRQNFVAKCRQSLI
jgi:hypothetical protein